MLSAWRANLSHLGSRSQHESHVHSLVPKTSLASASTLSLPPVASNDADLRHCAPSLPPSSPEGVGKGSWPLQRLTFPTTHWKTLPLWLSPTLLGKALTALEVPRIATASEALTPPWLCSSIFGHWAEATIDTGVCVGGKEEEERLKVSELCSSELPQESEDQHSHLLRDEKKPRVNDTRGQMSESAVHSGVVGQPDPPTTPQPWRCE